jgi:hypothetical protein
MKAYGGIRGIAPLFLNLGSRWRLVVKFILLSLDRRDIPLTPLDSLDCIYTDRINVLYSTRVYPKYSGLTL